MYDFFVVALVTTLLPYCNADYGAVALIVYDPRSRLPSALLTLAFSLSFLPILDTIAFLHF